MLSLDTSGRIPSFIDEFLSFFLTLVRVCQTLSDEEMNELIVILNTKLNLSCISKVPWLSNYLIIPGYLPIRAIYECLQDKQQIVSSIFPMDIASAIPSHILSQSRPCVSMDLCCSPGGKLVTLMDYSRSQPWQYRLAIGVDISRKRLQTCQSILHSYLASQFAMDESIHHILPRVLLFCADGTSFSASELGELVYDTHVDIEEIVSSNQTGRKRQNKSSRGRVRKKLKALQSSLLQQKSFSPSSAEESGESDPSDLRPEVIGEADVVLVDAQCTHDGSYRHMRYSSASAAWDDSKEDIDTPPCPSPSPTPPCGLSMSQVSKTVRHERNELQALQRGLILNGFDRLRRGGTMIYSTCSHEKAQNEEIVQWFLETSNQRNPNDGTKSATASLVPLPEWCARPQSPPTDFSSFHPLLPSILSSPDEELYSHLLELHHRSAAPSDGTRPNDLSLQSLSHDICRYFASLSSPQGRSSADLPETVSFGRWCGTSGLFMACIQKGSVQE
jgi:16S rRNA C967 or C1407 C5-methylase (RsmB/RsmF family)